MMKASGMFDEDVDEALVEPNAIDEIISSWKK